ncbi:MAG TPA: cupin domain-containing protein [Gemmataceae bacterium]|nr:cupin domain-containing protein [Gemmataceae bacterium]
MSPRLLAALAAGILTLSVRADDPPRPGGSPAAKLSHMVALPDDVKWGPAPPALPPGAKMVVLDGDPTKAGQFTIRAKFPDGYVIPPHWHSIEENLTVISGSFGLGLGDRLERNKIRNLPAGSYVRLGKEERHFAVAKGETVVQVHGMGPFDLHYVNPADDPTKK